VIRLLISAVVWLASAAIGLLIAKLVLEDMAIDLGSFLFVVVIFAVLQAVLSPFTARVAMRNAPALLGGAGLITTFVALLITSLLSDGLTIEGLDTWVFATLIVWIATMLATLVLPLLVGRRMIAARRDDRG
jgi:putative membrane protein